jgi:hypothetical protein
MNDPIAIPNDLAVFSFKIWRIAFALLLGAAIVSTSMRSYKEEE